MCSHGCQRESAQEVLVEILQRKAFGYASHGSVLPMDLPNAKRHALSPENSLARIPDPASEVSATGLAHS